VDGQSATSSFLGGSDRFVETYHRRMQVIGGRLGTTMRRLAITTCLLCVQACGAFLAPQVPLRVAAGYHLLRAAHAPAPQCLSTCRALRVVFAVRVTQTRTVGVRTDLSSFIYVCAEPRLPKRLPQPVSNETNSNVGKGNFVNRRDMVTRDVDQVQG